MNRKRHIFRNRNGYYSTSANIICTVVTVLFLFCFAFPILYVVLSSFIMVGNLKQPYIISFDGYKLLFENTKIWRGMWNSMVYSSVGTVISLALSILFGYAISSVNFQMNKLVSFLLLFTLYFSGGMIPTYLLIKKIHLLNTMWALILPSCISVYRTNLLATHLRTNKSRDLYDAARIDGCGHWAYLLYIVLPFITPMLFTMAFLFFTSYWNSYLAASIYITDPNKYPITIIINQIMTKNNESTVFSSTSNYISPQVRQMMQYSLIVFSSLPLLLFSLIIKKRTFIDNQID